MTREKKRITVRVEPPYFFTVEGMLRHALRVGLSGNFMRRCGETSVHDLHYDSKRHAFVFQNGAVCFRESTLKRLARHSSKPVYVGLGQTDVLEASSIMDVVHTGQYSWNVFWGDGSSSTFIVTEDQVARASRAPGFSLLAPESRYSSAIIKFQAKQNTSVTGRNMLDQWYEVLYDQRDAGHFSFITDRQDAEDIIRIMSD